MKKIILLFCILSLYHVVKGQSGIPDPSFGTNGSIITPPLSTGNIFSPIARQCFVQPDGKIYLVLQANSKTKITRRLSNGSADPSYGDNGYSFVTSMIVTAAALQTDGKIVVAGGPDGFSDFMLARYNTDGTLDNSFGNSGVMITDIGSPNDFVNAIVITTDGKIIVGGSTLLNGHNQFVLAGYTTEGITDGAFGNNGIVTTDFNNFYSSLSSLALQPDGKIVAAGVTGTNNGDFALARYNADGTADLSFNFTGQTTSDFGINDWARSVVISSDGKIYAGGQSLDNSYNPHFRIARYNADGSPDLSFNSGAGSVFPVFGDSYELLTNIRLQNDGKIIAAGHTNLNPSSQDIEMIRINTDGTLDNNFGNTGNGLVIADLNTGSDESDYLAIQQDGKIVTGGYNSNFTNTPSYSFTCFRFNADGSPDAGFDTNGSFIDFVPGGYYTYGAIFLQGDGKLLASGDSYNGTTTQVLINRFNANGTPDNTYGQNGTQEITLLPPTPYAIPYFQPDGKLLRLGYSNSNSGDIMLSRYNTDGTPDINFGNGGIAIADFGANESGSVAGFQPDGKIIVGGIWRNNSGSDLLVVRFNADGSVDGSFGNGGYVRIDFENEDQVQTIAVEPDGKIVFGGTGITFPPDFSYVHFDILIGRLLPDGSFDGSFGQQGKTIIDKADNEYMGQLQVQNDNKIILTRYQSTGGENPRGFLQRLNSDGTPDINFGQNGDTPCDGGAVLLQQDQKILILGNTINNLNNRDVTLTRFNTDGTPDLSFGTNGKTTSSFTQVDNYFYTALLSGNSLFAAGNGVDKTGLGIGLIAKFQLDAVNSVNCPADQIVNADPNLCAAKVYEIDPATAAGSAMVKYNLSGATTGAGDGSVSGKLFNTGATTVTYTLSTDATKSCSFKVTVQDNQLPVIEHLSVSQSTLWPPDHKLKNITVGYCVHDNCGIANTRISVSSTDPVQSGERDDLSPDWEILDAHHIRLRAEKLRNGNERKYFIKVITTDLSGNQNSATVTVTVPKSMGKPNPNLIVIVAPNPSSSYFLVAIHSNSADKINVRLLDNNGIVLNAISNVSSTQVLKIGGKLMPGIYFLQVTQAGITKTIKLVKQ